MSNQIEAAEKYAAKYDGDDRQDIKTDVLNAFYAGYAAALSAREGGEAVGEIDENEDGKFAAFYPDRNLPNGAPLYLHPAQPASQQGEKCERCDGSGVMVSDNHDEAPCVHCQPAHPTGNRVREALAKGRRVPLCGDMPEAIVFVGEDAAAIEAIAAALDQEKGCG